jgi:hypothetical protein
MMMNVRTSNPAPGSTSSAVTHGATSRKENIAQNTAANGTSVLRTCHTARRTSAPA